RAGGDPGGRAVWGHHTERLRGLGDHLGGGATAPCGVARRRSWPRRKRSLSELDVFNRTLAVLETAAHLELLGFRGSATVTDDDGGRDFTPAGTVPHPAQRTGGAWWRYGGGARESGGE